MKGKPAAASDEEYEVALLSAARSLNDDDLALAASWGYVNPATAIAHVVRLKADVGAPPTQHPPTAPRKYPATAREKARLAEYIEQTLKDFPPLRPEQRDRLRVLLHTDDE